MLRKKQEDQDPAQHHRPGTKRILLRSHRGPSYDSRKLQGSLHCIALHCIERGHYFRACYFAMLSMKTPGAVPTITLLGLDQT